jgi:hypothetical protein
MIKSFDMWAEARKGKFDEAELVERVTQVYQHMLIDLEPLWKMQRLINETIDQVGQQAKIVQELEEMAKSLSLEVEGLESVFGEGVRYAIQKYTEALVRGKKPETVKMRIESKKWR